MTKIFIKSQYKNKIKILSKLSVIDNKNILPPNLQIFKQKLLSGNGFMIYK